MNGLKCFQHDELMYTSNIWHIVVLGVRELKKKRVCQNYCIIVNLVFSGVLRRAEGKHILKFIKLLTLYFYETC